LGRVLATIVAVEKQLVLHIPKWRSRTNRELEEMSKGENIVKLIKEQRISWLGHVERMEEDRMPKKIFIKELEGRDEGEDPGEDGKGSRKRSSGGRSEQMERVGDRQEKMEQCCATGQSPQRAVVPMEEEKNYILRECVFVALGTYRGMRMRHIVICGLPCSTVFFHSIS